MRKVQLLFFIHESEITKTLSTYDILDWQPNPDTTPKALKQSFFVFFEVLFESIVTGASFFDMKIIK
jgi:hypothetical protein